MDKKLLKTLELIKSKGVKKTQIIKVLEKSPMTVYRILEGKRKLELEDIEKLANYFGLPITYWFDDDAKSVNIGSHNVVNGNNNKIEVQLNAEIERLKNEIEMLKVELRLKNELIDSLRAHIKSLMKLDK